MEIRKLTENRDFRRIYRRGRAGVHPIIVTYICPNRLGYNRIGITAGKKVGNAVRRNRAKRVILAAYRECLPHLRQGADIVFVARTRTPACKSTDVARALRGQWKAAGLWMEGQSS